MFMCEEIQIPRSVSCELTVKNGSVFKQFSVIRDIIFYIWTTEENRPFAEFKKNQKQIHL